MARFGKVLTAMVTPFGESGDLDLEVAASLANWLIANGNDGLVVAGTTGESPTLTHDEQTELIATVVNAVGAPVIAGAGSNDTSAAIELTQKADQAGASAILSVTPYYNRPSQAGLLDHFRAIAGATELPIVLYDIPTRSGRKIETETLLELAHTVDNIVALKDAAGDPSETAYFLSEAPKDFEVYSGDDSLTLPLMAIGAVGVIGVATHWTGSEHQKMMLAIENGNLEEAVRINANLQESFLYESSLEAPNPIPTKVMMELIGFQVGKGRPPMHSVPPNLRDLAVKVLAETEIGKSIESDRSGD
ncbi:MAG: 4-hydroxy-tetrahydrodipicolinate synthase [Acidimicrobiaceae bacterium]|nr:4-hydroxy-tetrahydrodipicolinate synthase [Acidimicrobiaceae bacterium]